MMGDSLSAKKIGWNFDNSYLRLPKYCYTKVRPIPVSDPRIVILNNGLANELGLTFDKPPQKKLAQIFSGNDLPKHSDPLAQAYAGHQFGHFTFLGDGRAHLLGEHITPDGSRLDIQLKGSGKTPYTKRGDGRASLGPMLREYIISEAMHKLGISTTRSLAVVTTGEKVYRNTILKGAVLTRVASSHMRIGTFQYLAAQKDVKSLKILADYAIDRHYPEIKESSTPYLSFLKAVMKNQIDLIVDWLRVGFIHGVMNTDNMSISGETIDYGPCAFMDEYDPETVFSSIDQMKRYSYANQPDITQWNLARFAEALMPLIHKDIKEVYSLSKEINDSFNRSFEIEWLSMMRRKLGLFGEDKADELLISNLLKWMKLQHADYTNTFRDLISETIPKGECYVSDDFQNWWQRLRSRQKQSGKPIKLSHCLMRANNPSVIPRNHQVEKALSSAEEQGDFKKLDKLIDVLSDPYLDKPEYKEFQAPPKPEERVYQTFCGT